MTTDTQPAPTDAEIAALQSEFGITSNGRGIKEFTQVRNFACAVLDKWGAPAVAGEPVAWRYVPSKVWGEFVYTEDPKRAQHARDNGIDVQPVFTTPQPTQAQAGAVPTREFMERTLAAMEGVIDVADRKTDEFDALRSCVIELTLMLFSNAKRHTKGADHER